MSYSYPAEVRCSVHSYRKHTHSLSMKQVHLHASDLSPTVQKCVQQREGQEVRFICRCSFLEIYKEVITDLLNPAATRLQIREDFKRGIHVEGLIEHITSSGTAPGSSTLLAVAVGSGYLCMVSPCLPPSWHGVSLFWVILTQYASGFWLSLHCFALFRSSLHQHFALVSSPSHGLTVILMLCLPPTVIPKMYDALTERSFALALLSGHQSDACFVPLHGELCPQERMHIHSSLQTCCYALVLKSSTLSACIHLIAPTYPQASYCPCMTIPQVLHLMFEAAVTNHPLKTAASHSWSTPQLMCLATLCCALRTTAQLPCKALMVRPVPTIRVPCTPLLVCPAIHRWHRPVLKQVYSAVQC